MTEKQIKDLVEGVGFLEYVGNLYECVGTEQGKYTFQSENDDSCFTLSYEELISIPKYSIAYKFNEFTGEKINYRGIQEDIFTVEPENLYALCVRQNWFTCGTNEQYDKMFRANKEGAPIEEIAAIIWVCSDDVNKNDILTILKAEREKYLAPPAPSKDQELER